MHELVENSHTDSDFLVLLFEGKCTHPDVDVGVCPVVFSLGEVSHIGQGLASATTASSDGLLAAHHLPLLLRGEHHFHGVLEADFDVLVRLLGASAEPLQEKLLVLWLAPVFVGLSHPVLHHECGLNDLFSLALRASGVFGDSVGDILVVELDVDASISSYNIITLLGNTFLGLSRRVAGLATGIDKSLGRAALGSQTLAVAEAVKAVTRCLLEGVAGFFGSKRFNFLCGLLGSRSSSC